MKGGLPAVGGGPVGVGKERRGRQDTKSHSLTMPSASLVVLVGMGLS